MAHMYSYVKLNFKAKGRGPKKKSRKKYGLLPNPGGGGGVSEGSEKTKLLF